MTDETRRAAAAAAENQQQQEKEEEEGTTMKKTSDAKSEGDGGGDVDVSKSNTDVATVEETGDVSGGGSPSSSSSTMNDGRNNSNGAGPAVETIDQFLHEFFTFIHLTFVMIGSVLWVVGFMLACVVWFAGQFILSCVFHGLSTTVILNGTNEDSVSADVVPPAPDAKVADKEKDKDEQEDKKVEDHHPPPIDPLPAVEMESHTSQNVNNNNSNKLESTNQDTSAFVDNDNDAGKQRKHLRTPEMQTRRNGLSTSAHSDDYRSSSGCSSADGDYDPEVMRMYDMNSPETSLMEIEIEKTVLTEGNLEPEFAEQELTLSPNGTTSSSVSVITEDLACDDETMDPTLDSKSMLNLWLRPTSCFKRSVEISGQQEKNGNSDLDLQTLQRILDFVALQAFLQLHRDSEHLRDQLIPLVCREVTTHEKASMDILKLMIES